jgi:tRNA-binding protein
VASEAPPRDTITYDDFLRLDVRVGTVISCEPFAEARQPAYKLRIDFGPGIGVRKSSAQVTELYRADDLIGRQVAAVVNFPPKQIGPFMSEVLVLGFPDADGRVSLITVDPPVPNGGRMF